MRANAWSLISIALLVWAVLASAAAANYYMSSTNDQKTIAGLNSIIQDISTKFNLTVSENGTILIKVNLGINYGNGTIDWHNGTIPYGLPLFNATLQIANVTYDVYPFGLLITAINGVYQNPSSNQYWVYEGWDNGEWAAIWIGSTEYTLHPGETIMWVLKQF